MVLLDISNSTRFELDSGYRIVDIERQAMLVLAEALSEVQDEFSIYAFSGYGRDQVNCLRLKDFDEDYNASAPPCAIWANALNVARKNVACYY